MDNETALAKIKDSIERYIPNRIHIDLKQLDKKTKRLTLAVDISDNDDYWKGMVIGLLLGNKLAEPKGKSKSKKERPVFFGAEGQWDCLHCGCTNHELRGKCRECGADKPKTK